jgi:hypothetical protein
LVLDKDHLDYHNSSCLKSRQIKLGIRKYKQVVVSL